MKFIDAGKFKVLIESLPKNDYREYLQVVLDEK
jgi:hypothetical protein